MSRLIWRLQTGKLLKIRTSCFCLSIFSPLKMQANQSWLPSILSSSIQRPNISRTAWVLGEKTVHLMIWRIKKPWPQLKTHQIFRSQEATLLDKSIAIQIPNPRFKLVRMISKWWFCKPNKRSKHTEIKPKSSFVKWLLSRVKATNYRKMFTTRRLDTQQSPSPTIKVNSKSSFEMR